MRHPQPPTEVPKAVLLESGQPGLVQLWERSRAVLASMRARSAAASSCSLTASRLRLRARTPSRVRSGKGTRRRVPWTACVASTTFPATCPGPGTSWLPWSNNRLVVAGHAQLSGRQAHRVQPGLVRETYTLTDPEKQTSQAQERLFLLY